MNKMKIIQILFIIMNEIYAALHSKMAMHFQKTFNYTIKKGVIRKGYAFLFSSFTLIQALLSRICNIFATRINE